MESADHDPIEIRELPPLHAADEIRRTPRTSPVPTTVKSLLVGVTLRL